MTPPPDHHHPGLTWSYRLRLVASARHSTVVRAPPSGPQQYRHRPPTSASAMAPMLPGSRGLNCWVRAAAGAGQASACARPCLGRRGLQAATRRGAGPGGGVLRPTRSQRWFHAHLGFGGGPITLVRLSPPWLNGWADPGGPVGSAHLAYSRQEGWDPRGVAGGIGSHGALVRSLPSRDFTCHDQRAWGVLPLLRGSG